MLALYSALYSLALAALFPREYGKRRGELRRRWLGERLGGLPPRESSRPLVWLHAVSVGEVAASVPFVRGLTERHPGLDVVVSTVTDTGQAVARERLGRLARVVYVPFDLRLSVRRALARLRPSLFIAMETELWPNTFRAMREAQVPVVILNGRISESSFRGYRKVRFLMRRVLRDVTLFCMQDDEYARRIRELGAGEEDVLVTGSFKFDVTAKGGDIPWAGGLTGPVVVAGSTHRGEDEIMLGLFRALKQDFPALTLILVPRHPERFDEVDALVRKEGLPLVRRTSLSGGERVSGSVVLLDTVGELSSVYGIADVVVMGGSFIRHGGQNPLEAMAWGKPVVCGPHMENFHFIKEFYDRGAAIEARENTLAQSVRGLLSSPQKRQSMGARARDILKANQGAVGRALDAVERFLPALP
jgi:3-deoxy-D-manno-octulosonic-acid transferase